jgi:hypothetical protein
MCMHRPREMLEFLEPDELLFDHVNFKWSIYFVANRLLGER